MPEQTYDLSTLKRRLAKLEDHRTRLIAAINALEALETESGTVDAKVEAKPKRHRARRRKKSSKPTMIEATEALLREKGKPMHISDIVAGIQLRGFRRNDPMTKVRASLIPTIDRKVSAGLIFTKPEPATYGLLEWGT